MDVAILGAGSAGITAMFALLKTGKSVVLINSGPEGSTCTRVGCMPSMALIEAANTYHTRTRMEMFGLHGSEGLSVDGPAVMARVPERPKRAEHAGIDAVVLSQWVLRRHSAASNPIEALRPHESPLK